eukprot:3629077-Rhodomonas_salina.1
MQLCGQCRQSMYESHHHMLAATSTKNHAPSKPHVRMFGHNSRPFLPWLQETRKREKAANEYSKWEQREANKIQQVVKKNFNGVDKPRDINNRGGDDSFVHESPVFGVLQQEKAALELADIYARKTQAAEPDQFPVAKGP